MKHHLHRWIAGILAITVLLVSPANAAPRAALTVTRADQTRVVLSVADLQALPQHSFSARTPWYKDAVVFTGPLLRDVLRAAGVQQGQQLLATALDDYKISIPFADAQTFNVITALAVNGQALTTRDKGPLFIVYPFDSDTSLQSLKYYERSIWQLRALEVQ